MEAKALVQAILAYQRAVGMTDLARYTSTPAMDRAYPGIFGMNFGLMEMAPELRGKEFLDQECRANLFRDVLAGKNVDEGELKRLLGVSAGELAAVQAEMYPLKKAIPDKLVVLSFDDAMKDQYTVAAPLLKKLGFGATFFITEMEESTDPHFPHPAFSDKTVYMDWDEIKKLQDMGFELGNHSLHHVFGAHTRGVDFQRQETRGMEAEFEAHGLKKPLTYAYPSGICNKDTYQAAEEYGYLWARGNMEDGVCAMSAMTYYDPLLDSPLAMRSFGDPDFYSEQLLQMRIDGAKNGKILGLTYHSVLNVGNFPNGADFKRQMEILKENGCTVISTAQLDEYIDPVKAREYTRPV